MITPSTLTIGGRTYHLLVIDFETFWDTPSRFSLKYMSTESYVRDPRFAVHLCGVKPGSQQALWVHRDELRGALQTMIDWPNTAVIAQHAHFDGLILSHHYGVRPGFWLDTLSMARIVRGPKVKNGLEALVNAYGLRTKDVASLNWSNGKTLAQMEAQPAEFERFTRYCRDDCENEYDIAQLFVPQIPEMALRAIDAKVRMFTEPVFVGDIALLEQAVTDELARKQALFERLGAVDAKVFSSSAKFAELLAAVNEEVPMKISPAWAKAPSGPVKLIPALSKTDPGMQALLESERDEVRWLAEARLASKSTIIGTRARRFLECARRGLMPVYLKPYGVHTGRSSASDGMNWLNLSSHAGGRPEMTVIKRAVQAPPGCKVVSVDSAQVQARLTAWLFGQHDVVEAFAQGRDVYSEFASDIYRRPVDRKRVKADYIPGQVGKISVLGFGFGQGWYTAAVNFLKGHLGAPPIQFTDRDLTIMGINPSPFQNNPHKVRQVLDMPSRLTKDELMIHCIVSHGIVYRWRERNEAIVDGWDLMERVIDAMLRGDVMRFGPGRFLYTEPEAIVLPSGMRLRYRDLQRDSEGQATYWNGKNREKVYGGSLTNNVVQGLEQEILTPQLLTLHDMGYKVATEVYDSITCVVPEEYAVRCRDDMVRVMSQGPEWAVGLPLMGDAGDGGIGNTYQEAK